MNKELLRLKTNFIEKNVKFDRNYISDDEVTKLREKYGHTDEVPNLRFDNYDKKFYEIDTDILSDEELNLILMLKLNEKITSDYDKQKKIDEFINLYKENLSVEQTTCQNIIIMKNIMLFWLVLTILGLLGTFFILFNGR